MKLKNKMFDSFKDYYSTSEGFTAVQMPDGKWAFRNEQGVVSKDRYDEVKSYCDSFAAVKKDGKWAFRDKEGKLGAGRYDEVRSYCEGFAAVKIDGKWAFIDKEGKLGAGRYDEVMSYSEGFAAVKIDGKWAFINKQGEMGKKRYLEVSSYKGGRAGVRTSENEKWSYIDMAGKSLTNENKGKFGFKKFFSRWSNKDKDKNISKFEHKRDKSNFKAVKIDGEWGFVDKKGNLSLSKETIKTVFTKDFRQFQNIPTEYFKDNIFIDELIEIAREQICKSIDKADDVTEKLKQDSFGKLKFMKKVIIEKNIIIQIAQSKLDRKEEFKSIINQYEIDGK